MLMGLQEESAVKKHHSSETLVKSLTKIFDGYENGKVRVSNSNEETLFIP